MVFTTHEFLFYFLPATLAIYFASPRRLRTLVLAISSFLFYGWSNPGWALLMFCSTMVDYICGLRLIALSGLPDEGELPPMLPKGLPRSRLQTLWLTMSIVSNLFVLGLFKYYNFIADNANALSGALGQDGGWMPALALALPVGISFYTFQSMSYAIDVYRGDARAMRSVIDFCCFEALYPQLVAGPIVRFAHVADQIRERKESWELFARGVAFFSCGLAKKVLLANPMGYVADIAFGSAALHWYDAWFGLLAYAFQIYFDFSGYSDMAVGLGLMLGFRFIKNFDSPYLSESITDFWRRWHISLSTWLRDYLYIPLGGNRKGPLRTYVNLMTVMLLGGLWHGASWNFVLWGAVHGSMLAFERLRAGTSRSGVWGGFERIRPFRVVRTFLIVSAAWVFFRAPTLSSALQYFASLAGLADVTAGAQLKASLMYTPYHLLVAGMAAAITWGSPQTWNFTRELTPAKASYCFALLAAGIVMIWTQSDNPFIYFQF